MAHQRQETAQARLRALRSYLQKRQEARQAPTSATWWWVRGTMILGVTIVYPAIIFVQLLRESVWYGR